MRCSQLLSSALRSALLRCAAVAGTDLCSRAPSRETRSHGPANKWEQHPSERCRLGRTREARNERQVRNRSTRPNTRPAFAAHCACSVSLTVFVFVVSLLMHVDRFLHSGLLRIASLVEQFGLETAHMRRKRGTTVNQTSGLLAAARAEQRRRERRESSEDPCR